MEYFVIFTSQCCFWVQDVVWFLLRGSFCDGIYVLWIALYGCTVLWCKLCMLGGFLWFGFFLLDQLCTLRWHSATLWKCSAHLWHECTARKILKLLMDLRHCFSLDFYIYLIFKTTSSFFNFRHVYLLSNELDSAFKFILITQCNFFVFWFSLGEWNIFFFVPCPIPRKGTMK